jgi:hypothetical protein
LFLPPLDWRVTAARPHSMKKKIAKGLLYIALGYLLLVALHLLYLELGGRSGDSFALMQAMAPNEPVQLEMPGSAGRGGSKSSYGNYATLSFKAMPTQAAVEQKYEKIGSLTATTAKFDPDEQRARAIVKEHNALIQEEAVNSSNELRQLSLTIGVPPDNFDAVVAALQTVGKTVDYQVTKTDKTNDFLELKAKRTTLEKARDSLVGLKAQGGKIEELVKLEQEVLKLEDQIQGLGVQLGQFDKVNEFCTVRFTLAERKETVVRSPHLGYLIASIEWAGSIYLAWLGLATVGLVAVLLLLIIVDKSKIFRNES